MDEETGLYYFGARYYDPVVSQWVSTDPPMSRGDYFPTGKQLFFPEDEFDHRSLPSVGGVYNSVNLNLYHYVGQNPVKLIDPDGNQIFGNGEINFIRAINNGDNKMASHYAGVIADGLGYSSAVSYSAGFDAGLLHAFTGLNPGPKSSGVKEDKYNANFYTGKGIGEKTASILRAIGGAKVVSGIMSYLIKNPAIAAIIMDVAAGMTPSLASNFTQVVSSGADKVFNIREETINNVNNIIDNIRKINEKIKD